MFTKPYMDWKYGRISVAEVVGDVVENVATGWTTAEVGGAVLKGAGKLAEPVLKAVAAKFSELLLKSKSYNAGNPSVNKGKITRNNCPFLDKTEQKKSGMFFQ